MYQKEIVDLVKKRYPKFKIEKKSESTLMKIIHWALLVLSFRQMKRFMEYITTIGYTVYVPDRWDVLGDRTRASILVHEARHMYQKELYGTFRYTFGYLLWPLPVGFSNFRLDMEIDANAVQIWYEHEKFKFARFGGHFWSVVDALSGPDYLWPTFSREKVEEKLRKAINRQSRIWLDMK